MKEIPEVQGTQVTQEYTAWASRGEDEYQRGLRDGRMGAHSGMKRIITIEIESLLFHQRIVDAIIEKFKTFYHMALALQPSTVIITVFVDGEPQKLE